MVLRKSKPPEPGWAYLLVALFTSIGGILMGWIYLVKDGAQNKRFGIAALLLGLILPAIILLIFASDQARQAGSNAPLPQQPGVILPQ